MHLVNSEATRGDRILDKYLCDSDIFQYISTLPLTIDTDHRGVLVKVVGPSRKKRKIFFRDQRVQYRQYCNMFLDRMDLSYILDMRNTNDAASALQEELTSVFDHCCPLRAVTLRETEPPFITPVIKLLLKKKNRLVRRNRNSEAELLAIRIRKEIFANTYRGKTGTKQWWKQVNYYAKPSNAPGNVDFDTDELNAHYNRISTNLAQARPTATVVHNHEPPEVSTHLVYNYLLKIKSSAAGPDGLPAWLFRENAHNLAEPLAHIFNASLKSMIFPECWKIGRITPVPNVQRPKSHTDFRPVCITSIISRLFERVVFDTFFSESYHKNLPSDQFGFRRGYSTTFALLKLLHDIHQLRSTQDYVRVITLDLSKAFDTVSHISIIDSLKTLEPCISPYLINWFADFLSSRILHDITQSLVEVSHN